MLDPIILANHCVLSGDDLGTARPNDNVLVEGVSGGGKTTSVLLPTVFRQEHMNPVLCFAKEQQAMDVAAFLQEKGYQIGVLNRTVSWDPMDSCPTDDSLDALSTAMVGDILTKTTDSYWPHRAQLLLKSLMQMARMVDEDASMEIVLGLFDRSMIKEELRGFSCGLDDFVETLEKHYPDAEGVREYQAFKCLPASTAGCVRDSLATPLSTLFPGYVRRNMRALPRFDFQALAGPSKYALIVISNPCERGQEAYYNLFFRDCFHNLHKIAQRSPHRHLPRPVRFYFDDFGVSAPIQDFDADISFMREDGMSVMLLIQSTSQLESVYGREKATIIRQNIPTQVYLPGGFDLHSCEEVSRKMDLPLSEVLFAPLGKAFVMRTGQPPLIAPRYPTLESEEYLRFRQIVQRSCTRGTA